MQLTDHHTPRRTITFDRNRLTLEDIVDIAHAHIAFAMDGAPVTEDRRLDPEPRLQLGRIRDQAWRLYA